MCLVTVTRGPCIPESHGTVAIKEVVLGRLLLTEHCTDSRLRHTPIFLCRKPLGLFWSFCLRGRLQVWHTSIGLQSFLSSSIGCGHHLGLLSLFCSSLPVSPRKKAYLLSSGVYHCHPRNTARLPGRQGLYLQSHRTTYICMLLKAAA